MRPCFARVEPWLQAGKYAAALMSDLPRRNGWTLAERAGDRAPDRMQRLLSRAVWDALAVMRAVRRFAVAGLDQAACHGGRRGLAVGAIDETSQVKQGERTAGVKRHYLGCAGKVANGITTVHLAYAREGTGHALIAARQWIPREQLEDPARRKMMRLAPGLAFRTKGQLAIGLLGGVLADGIGLDFVCGDEVYGRCPQLREYLEACAQAYVLRVPSNFCFTVARGVRLTCKQAAAALLGTRRGWEVRSAGAGAKGQRWYAWAWLGTASSRHYLLIRRHLTSGELAFHYCFVPGGQRVSLSRLVRAAGCRWPPPPYRHPGTRPAPAGPAPARRPGVDPAHRPRDRPAARPSAPARRQPALAGLAPPPPGPVSLVPPARPAHPKRAYSPGQLTEARILRRLAGPGGPGSQGTSSDLH